MDFTKGDLAKSKLPNNHTVFVPFISIQNMQLVTYILHLIHFISVEMENLVTTYKLPRDYFSEVYLQPFLYLQPFQILKWRKV